MTNNRPNPRNKNNTFSRFHSALIPAAVVISLVALTQRILGTFSFTWYLDILPLPVAGLIWVTIWLYRKLKHVTIKEKS